MARPKSISDEEVLLAARDVFLEHGLQATTAEIAKRAGISEGSIFRRYPSKTALFFAAMHIEQPRWFATAESLEQEEDVVAAVREVTDQLLDFMIEMLPRLHMILACGRGTPRFESGDAPPVVALRVLERFFRAHTEAGRMSASEPQALARIFVGACHHYAFAHHSGINALIPMDRGAFVEELTRRVLAGAA